MKSIKKRLLYFLYLMGVMALSLYFLFPSDAVKNYISDKVNQTSDGIIISIDHVKPVFPPGLALHTVLLSQATQPLFGVKRLNIVPVYRSLFSPQKIFIFEGESYDGILKGQTLISGSKEKRQLKIDAEFSGIQIKKIAAIPNAARRMISGRLDGKMNYQKNPAQEEQVDAELILLDPEIRLPEAFLQLKSLNFSKIEAKASFANQNLQIRECAARGNQIDLEITGTIRIRDNLEKSVFNLKGTKKPHHLFHSGLGKTVTKLIFPDKNISEKGLPFQINGPMDQLSFEFN